jgi:hypothetical protein
MNISEKDLQEIRNSFYEFQVIDPEAFDGWYVKGAVVRVSLDPLTPSNPDEEGEQQFNLFLDRAFSAPLNKIFKLQPMSERSVNFYQLVSRLILNDLRVK